MSKIYQSVDELIGHTPLMELTNIEKKFDLKGRLFAKLEMFNPAGSAKDRVALTMLNEAEKRGDIDKDTVIIEPTSGNTGIGLASVGSARGYRVIIVMPDSMSVERRLLMSAYGAELVLTPGAEGMTGAIVKANELKAQYPKSYIPGQFDNPDNAKAHYDTTGPEIWDDLDGQVDAFVAGIGTGGTITGTGRFLKSKNKDIHIVGVEPASSAVLSGKAAGSHGLMGIGAGFIPSVLDTKIYDEIITMTEEKAYEAGRLLGTVEGLLVGITSGAALSAAIELCQKEEYRGRNVVALLPDTGERYLSSPMFTN